MKQQLINGLSFVIGAAATTGNAQVIYNQSAGDLSLDLDGTGVGAAVKFAHVTSGLTLSAADFHVVF